MTRQHFDIEKNGEDQEEEQRGTEKNGEENGYWQSLLLTLSIHSIDIIYTSNDYHLAIEATYDIHFQLRRILNVIW